ncbi:MAG: hypothetical protein AMS17_00485 [Spirochaetes bacterium DG_61]|nr:MAG: hypothetical protein AMS17_00485 [Spirochaetes bacterium DG_61]
MCQKIDRSFFNRLAALDPGEVCRRTLAQYDRKKKRYRIEAFGIPYEVDPELGDILPVGEVRRPVSVELGLLVLFYLLSVQDIPLAEKWVNEFSLKGGALFFRGPHAIRNREIADRFGNDIDGFKAVCTGLGAQPLTMGDAAFRFQVLPRIPVVVVLWYGDDEFEASAKLLMDATIDSHLPLDVIYALAVELVEMLLGNR